MSETKKLTQKPLELGKLTMPEKTWEIQVKSLPDGHTQIKAVKRPSEKK